jgi:hypothetical protein
MSLLGHHDGQLPPLRGIGKAGLLKWFNAERTSFAFVKTLGSRGESPMNSTPNDVPPSEQIDAIIEAADDWKGETLSHLRAVIKKADPPVIEEVKWKKPSQPEGVPVWSHNGNLCIANLLKNSVRLTFPKGAQMKDPKGLFNARLDSRTVRAVDFGEDDVVDQAAVKALILEAVELNS